MIQLWKRFLHVKACGSSAPWAVDTAWGVNAYYERRVKVIGDRPVIKWGRLVGSAGLVPAV